MWLINTTSLRLEFFTDSSDVKYAILSHTWDHEEVTFQDFQGLPGASLKKGFKKIEVTCKLALERGLEYAWVDTCCIDKTNHVELTESINSMFRWYRDSSICFAYLSDLVPLRNKNPDGIYTDLRHCRWFRRGWTLQELIAPRHLEILDREWTSWGQKTSLATEISGITGIEKGILIESIQLRAIPVARKMSWAARRETTRVEDTAYCLLGIFDINMPMIYGEGYKAFYRLQEEIAKETNDMSLFAWTMRPGGTQKYRGIFAQSPDEFTDCDAIQLMLPTDRFNQEFAITNKGFRVDSVIARVCDLFVLNLQCFDRSRQAPDSVQWLGIFLTKTVHGYVRARPGEIYFASQKDWHFGKKTRIYIPKRLNTIESAMVDDQYSGAIFIKDLYTQPYRVESAGPEDFWDSSKGLFLAGAHGRFTGYLLCQTQVGQTHRTLRFFVICGRQHFHSEECHDEYWCLVVPESKEAWKSVWATLEDADAVADVASLDYLYQSLQPRQLLPSSRGLFQLGTTNVEIVATVRRNAPGDFNDHMAFLAGSSAHCIDISLILFE